MKRVLIASLSLAVAIVVMSGMAAMAATVLDEETEAPVEGAVAWQIDFRMSGGIAGLSRQLLVSSDGSYRIVDARANREVGEGQLAEETLLELDRLVGGVDLYPQQTDFRDRSCMDCFSYSLAVDTLDASVEYRLSDTTFDASGMADLVAALRQIFSSSQHS